MLEFSTALPVRFQKYVLIFGHLTTNFIPTGFHPFSVTFGLHGEQTKKNPKLIPGVTAAVSLVLG